MCAFLTNAISNKENWKIGKGKVNSADTGPSVDHTLGTVPATVPPVTITEMPETSITCNFDNGHFCSWRKDSSKLNWQISVPAKTKDKMPKFDHTSGNYLGTITSPVTMSTWIRNFCFGFWYYINVEGDNRLKVTAEHTLYWFRGAEFVSFWSREGNTGYRWRHAYVHVKSNKINPRIQIYGKVKIGVIAIDDLAARGGSCPPPKVCTFDDDDYMCGYTDDSNNTVHWEVKSGEDNDTLFRMPDHTTQSFEGKYLYIGFKETPVGSLQSSRIYSPPRAPSPAGHCVTFFYHIHNVSQLALNTYLTKDGGLSDLQWSVTIDQGLLWHGARFPIVFETEFWRLMFEVEVGSQGYGQVAIDDVTITNGNCPSQGYCDFETEDCLWENVRDPFDPNIRKLLDAQHADVTKNLLKDDFDWDRHIGADYFGPSRDRTLGSPQGFYLLLDSRYSTPGQKAVYVSERLRTSSEVCFMMWYSIPNYKNGASLLVFMSGDFKSADQLQLIRDPTNEIWTQRPVTIVPSRTSDSPFIEFWLCVF
ncbi:MAM and LDL-receptor class A domain-containing protein 2 [Caerostris darwini]|uniref:MAM and LDL-receptor class A domain-containing protein 2 n=1 Tax=Caerostris darwini TaxID=1538125 RepID=A0AAV4PVT2_9ARAC|nr:MAM and LDL-receptor class A domain-containing protein 2 [Caerostris darwini]